MQYLEDFLPSQDSADEYEIPYKAWLCSKPKAAMVLAHGLAEHAQRYEQFATYLNEQGINVWALEQRGHGEQCANEDLGHYSDANDDGKNGWQKVVDDLIQFRQFVATQESENLPLFLFGHSMGSYAALTSVMQNAEGIKGLILSASGASNSIEVFAGLQVARIEKARQGQKGKSKLIDFLSFSKFNNEFKPNRTAFDWLSRDETQVDMYIDDPYCGFLCTNQTWIDILKGQQYLNTPANYQHLPKNLPITLLSGDKCPVGQSGKGVHKMAGRIAAAGIKDLKVKLYPEARHEIVNEINRDEVWEDVSQWIVERI